MSRRQATPRPQSPPQWPLWARLLRARRLPGELGVGDTLARVIGPIGGDAFKVWHHAVFGRTCRCAQRQAAFNARYPYLTPPRK